MVSWRSSGPAAATGANLLQEGQEIRKLQNVAFGVDEGLVRHAGLVERRRGLREVGGVDIVFLGRKLRLLGAEEC